MAGRSQSPLTFWAPAEVAQALLCSLEAQLGREWRCRKLFRFEVLRPCSGSRRVHASVARLLGAGKFRGRPQFHLDPVGPNPFSLVDAAAQPEKGRLTVGLWPPEGFPHTRLAH